MTHVHHMQLSKLLLFYLGVRRDLQLKNWSHKKYKVYSIFVFTYFITFTLGLFIKSVQLLLILDKQINQNMDILLPFLLIFYKYIIIKSQTIKDCIQEISKQEDKVLLEGDEDVNKISLEYSELNKKICSIPIYSVASGSAFLTSIPFITTTLKKIPYNNVTGQYEKPFVYVTWFPFDEQKYYYSAYIFHAGASIIGLIFYLGTLVLIISVLVFIVGQLKILQYKFRNFTHYFKKCQAELKIGEREAQRKFLFQCIEDHQNIIQLTDQVRDAFAIFFLFDFVVIAFQMAMVCIELLLLPKITLAVIPPIMHIANLYIQCLVIYSPATEVFEQSMQISDAIFEGDWYTYPIDIQKCMVLIIARSHRPLYMSVGPFYKMGVFLLSKITNTFYSSFCYLIQKF